MSQARLLPAFVFILAVVFFLSGCARETPVGANASTTYSEDVVARVSVIDPTRRQLVLQSSEGQVARVNVPPKVRNFDQIRVGDTVRIAYASEVDIVVAGHIAPMPGIIMQAGSDTAPAGKKPAGIWGMRTQRSVQIVGVDKATHTVTFREPDGSVDSIVVRDPANFALADGLTPGTVVQVFDTEGMAASVSKI